MSESETIELLTRISEGDSTAVEKLAPLVYERLRAIASRYFRKERPNHTLQPTALVNEAYLQLVRRSDLEWEGRTHFLAIAASEMRRILVDHARARSAKKRGGGQARVTLDGITLESERDLDAVELQDAIEKLSTLDPRAARVVELRFYAGLGWEEIAALLGVTPRTIRDDWRTARAWLCAELEP